MSISRQEEMIAATWAIAALLAFMGDYTAWGWFFAVKAAGDTVYAIFYAVKEIIAERKKAGM